MRYDLVYHTCMQAAVLQLLAHDGEEEAHTPADAEATAQQQQHVPTQEHGVTGVCWPQKAMPAAAAAAGAAAVNAGTHGGGRSAAQAPAGTMHASSSSPQQGGGAGAGAYGAAGGGAVGLVGTFDLSGGGNPLIAAVQVRMRAEWEGRGSACDGQCMQRSYAVHWSACGLCCGKFGGRSGMWQPRT